MLFDEFAPATPQAFLEKVLHELKGKALESLQSSTPEGVTIRPFYTKEDISVEAGWVESNLGKSFVNAEYIEVIDTASTLQRLHEAFTKGADAVVLDLMRCNLSQLDFGSLNQVLAIYQKPVGYKLMRTASIFMQQNERLPDGGFVAFDFLADWCVQGKMMDTANFERLAQLIKKYGSQNRSLWINAKIFHSAGATIVQELAFALALAVEYMDRLTERGLDVATLANNVFFSLSIGENFFLEIAKLRALRLLWRNVLQSYDPNTVHTMPYIHTQTSRFNKPGTDMYNNMVRTTLEGMSGVLGGADWLSILPYNQNWGETDEFARRVARNIGIMFKEEAHLDKVRDAGAGAYAVEKLTQQLAIQAWQLFQKVETAGGFVKSFEKGIIQADIEQNFLKTKSAFQTLAWFV